MYVPLQTRFEVAGEHDASIELIAGPAVKTRHPAAEWHDGSDNEYGNWDKTEPGSPPLRSIVPPMARVALEISTMLLALAALLFSLAFGS